MSNVLTFKRPEAPAPKVNLDIGERFCCLRCDSQQFLLTSTGHVFCVACSARMSNLFVTKGAK